MARSILKVSALALLAASSALGVAQAGGFARGTADTDIIYEDGNFNLRAGVTYVSPTRKYTKNANPALVGTSYTDAYVVPSAAIKLNINDDMRCAGTVSEPYGGSTTFAAPTASGKLSEKFTVTELGLTCGYKFDLSKGRAWVIGGVFADLFDYDLFVYRNAASRVAVDLNGTDVGFRLGAAYEIPEIALRAQLMYRSATSYGADGNFKIVSAADPSVVFASVPATGTGNLPQNVELKLQSGVAPGWLVMGSVKWTDWSVTKQLTINSSLSGPIPNNYFWKDGWTVSAGVGHAFNDKWSGAASITWDQGVKTGWDLSSDTYSFGAGASYKDDMGGELKFGGGVTYITSAAETKYAGPLNSAVSSGWAWALGASYKTKW